MTDSTNPIPLSEQDALRGEALEEQELYPSEPVQEGDTTIVVQAVDSTVSADSQAEDGRLLEQEELSPSEPAI